MSEPDAVPLPREGEVFFDVRGAARSMRLSWYADSRVAVFSIWQGDRCTGTFRLPFGDLARMVQTLQHAPQPAATAMGSSSQPGGASQPPYGAGSYPAPAASDPARDAYHYADLPGHPSYAHASGYADVPRYSDLPGYRDSAGYDRTGADYRNLPGHSAGPDYGNLPGHGAGPDYGNLPGHASTAGYATHQDRDLEGYRAAATSDPRHYRDLPGSADLPPYPGRPDIPDLPSYPRRPEYAPDYAAPSGYPSEVTAPTDRDYDHIEPADFGRGARTFSGVAGQSQWLAAPAVTASWGMTSDEPDGPGLAGFPSVPAKTGPAAPDRGRSGGY